MDNTIPEHDADHSLISDLLADNIAAPLTAPEIKRDDKHDDCDEPDDAEESDETEPEENEAETNLRIILQLYHQTFKKQLAVLVKELKPDALAKMHETQLKKLRDKCDKLLCGVSSVLAMVATFNAMIGLLEGTTTAIGYQTTGLTATLALDKHFQEVDLPRLALKYLDPRMASAEFSVAMKIITTAFAQNQRATVVPAKPAQAAPNSDIFGGL